MADHLLACHFAPIITLYVDELSFLKNEMKKNLIFEEKKKLW